MGHEAGEYEVTHETHIPYGEDELIVRGWESPSTPEKWILNVNVPADGSPHDRLTFPVTVNSPSFEDAAGLAAVSGLAKYQEWRQ